MTKKFIFFITLIINFVSFSQNSQVIGIVLNEFSEPVSNVNISTKDTGVSSDENGFFKINIICKIHLYMIEIMQIQSTNC